MSRIITVMIFALGIACPAIASTNLLQNPGFESGDLMDWQVEGQATSGVSWDGTQLLQAYFQPAQVVRHSGSYAAFNLTANFKRLGSLLSQELTVLPNTRYEAGFWILHGHPTQSVRSYPDILINGQPIGSLTITGGKGYGTSSADYQLVKGEFITGCDQRSVRISFVLKASGLMLAGMSYDDFFVRCSQPVINISPTSGTCGTLVCLSGWNFQPEEQVRLELEPDSASVIATDENGACSATFTIPQHSSGTLTITAVGLQSHKAASDCFTLIPRSDYGDAPNSRLYPMNTGYFCQPDDFTSPLFLRYQAHFPPVSHQVVSDCWLGKTVSLEAGEYDLQYDEDCLPNIEPYKGRADQDNDDGLVLPVDLVPNATNTVQFGVSAAPDAPPGLRYVNILFDWNQDGVWSGNEWAVRNQMVKILPGEHEVITSTPFLAGTNTGGCWMRLTLTPETISRPDWDGSGDFDGGETEDWLINIAPVCDLWMQCNVPKQVQLGQVIICRLEYGNQGQAVASKVLVTMDIPQGLTYLSDTVGARVVGNKMVWQIDSLYPGQQAELEASLRVEPWGGILSDSKGNDSQLSGTVSIDVDLPDTETLNNAADWSIRVVSITGKGEISGRVIDSSSNRPISSALVKAMQYEPFLRSNMTMTNTAGEYILDRLPAGTYTVSAELEGYTTRCYQGTVVINADNRVNGVDISLMPMLDDGLIAFRLEGSEEGIRVKNADGTRNSQLTFAKEASSPFISPDGKMVVFIRGGDVWVINTKGKDERQLTTSGHASCPSFSSDNRQIVFCDNDAVCTINADATGYCQLFSPDNTGGCKTSYPTLSPDNTAMVFCMDGDMYLMNTDSLAGEGSSSDNGHGLHRLTNTPEIEYAPTFSPDGTVVMFTRCDDSGDIGLWVMKRDGSHAQNLINDGCLARFSPNGRQVVFASARDGEHSLYVIDRDGGLWKKIAIDDEIAAAKKAFSYPSWGCSPMPDRIYVWPGDTNNDGMVNEQDIFPIAVWWGKTGAARDGNLRWQAQLAAPWDEVSATDRGAASYADANGDGAVNTHDILPVGMNWGKSHPISGSVGKAPGTYKAAPLAPEDIDHARYMGIYRAMDDLLGSAAQSTGVLELQRVLHGFIDEGSSSDLNEKPLPEIQSQKIGETNLLQNYPNPFNPECWIPFELAEEASVRIRIYNISGQLVKTLDMGMLEPGAYITQSRAAHWDGKNEDGDEIASGVYFYQMQAGDRVMKARRAVVLK